MTMQRIDLSDDSADFETVIGPDGRPRKILKDGRRTHFRMTDAQTLDLHDGRGGLVGHRPGFVVATDAASLNDAKAKAYDEVEARMTSAWRNPLTGSGSQTPVGAQPGDLCTCRGVEYPNDFGAPGHLQERDGRLVCVPDQPRSASPPASRPTAGDAAAIKDAAYRSWEDEKCSAWRGDR
jgi:hypothetical protein